jgi:hypothetical protein
MKKYIFLSLGIFYWFYPATSHASIIPLPSGFMDDILGNVSTILTDLGPYLSLILSVMLAAIVLEIIIGAVKRH